jgi:hypothetical protein
MARQRPAGRDVTHHLNLLNLRRKRPAGDAYWRPGGHIRA